MIEKSLDYQTMSALVEIVFIWTGIHAPTQMDGFWMIEIDVCNSSGSKSRRRVMSDLIERKAAIEVIDAIMPVEPMKNEYTQGITCGAALAIEYVKQLPPAQPEIAEKLYQYKCYITDKEGLQHEVVHTGDIRRVTGWEI